MTEMELKVSGGRIISAEVKDGILKILVEEAKEAIKDTTEVLKTEVALENHGNFTQFVLVKASSLSLADAFMKYEPEAWIAQEFKKTLTEVIKEGVHDFYRPNMDPSFDSHGKICYQAGLEPAVGKSYNWWEKNAKDFCPERKSRLGTMSEYVAFIGVLLKKLVESGWSIADAWNAVAYDSKNLGHYKDSDGALHDFEPTGSREICGFFDLANTIKLVANSKESDGTYWMASNSFHSGSWKSPIADIIHIGGGLVFTSSFRNICVDTQHDGVGWLVLEE